MAEALRSGSGLVGEVISISPTRWRRYADLILIVLTRADIGNRSATAMKGADRAYTNLEDNDFQLWVFTRGYPNGTGDITCTREGTFDILPWLGTHWDCEGGFQ